MTNVNSFSDKDLDVENDENELSYSNDGKRETSTWYKSVSTLAGVLARISVSTSAEPRNTPSVYRNVLESKREDSTKVEISEIGPVKQHHIETIGKSSIEDGQPEGNIAISLPLVTSVSDNNHEGFQPRMSELQLPFAGRSNPTRKKFVIIQIRTNGNVISRKVTLKNSDVEIPTPNLIQLNGRTDRSSYRDLPNVVSKRKCNNIKWTLEGAEGEKKKRRFLID